MAYKRKKQVDMSTFPIEKQREKARSYLVWYLARQMETEHVLRTKLKRKKYSDSVIDEIINEFLESNIINDEAYVTSFMNSTRVENLGKNGIKRKLMEKGVSDELLESVEDDYDQEDDQEKAYDMALRKAQSFSPDLDYQKKMSRLTGLLSRRGFPGDIVFSTARQVIEETTPDEEGDY